MIAQYEVLTDRAHRQFEDAGLTVPAQMSIAVLGDPPRGRRTTLDWTTFAIPRRTMVGMALTTLIEMGEAARQRYADKVHA